MLSKVQSRKLVLKINITVLLLSRETAQAPPSRLRLNVNTVKLQTAHRGVLQLYKHVCFSLFVNLHAVRCVRMTVVFAVPVIPGECLPEYSVLPISA